MINYIPFKNTYLFTGNEVCKALGYKDGAMNHCLTLKRHCPSALNLKHYINEGLETLPSSSTVRTKMLTTEEVILFATHSEMNGGVLLQWMKEEGLIVGEIIAHTTRDEHIALSTIEQLLDITLIRQFKVGDYKIDGYDVVNKVAYEIDEPFHSGQADEDEKRQKFIETVLGCTFKRIKV